MKNISAVPTIITAVLMLVCSNLFAHNSSTAQPIKHSHLVFVENKGQITDQNNHIRKDIDFTLKTKGLSIFIGNGAIYYQFCRSKETAGNNPFTILPKHASEEPTPIESDMYRMDVKLIGANKYAQVVTEQQQIYYENHYTANLPNGVTAHTFTRVTYQNIYPNIDWVLYIKDETLKHEFIVRQGGRVSDIRLNYGGATELKLNNKGELIASTPMGDITEQAPYSYDKNNKTVASQFVLNNNTVCYKTGDYTGDLVIDPSLTWGTYFGGSGDDITYRSAVDAIGNVYKCGKTRSTTGIATSGTHQTVAGGDWDAFLAKYDNGGSILWATFYGGAAGDYGWFPEVDGVGNIYMCGHTQSTTAIATAGAFQTILDGPSDAFLVKFNSAGSRLWGTYFGGSGFEIGEGIATDFSGNVYLVGKTTSSGLATSGAHQTTNMGANDAYVVKFTSSGARLWSTFYGGASDDEFYCAKTDATGNLYIGGHTRSSTGIATSGAYQTVWGGGTNDACFVKFNSAGVRQWGTYLGGGDYDACWGITFDASGGIYYVGNTASTSGIATLGAHQTTYGGGPSDGYIAKFNSLGAMNWSTYFGGSGDDFALGVASDALGNVFFAGSASSVSAIATSSALQPTNAGGIDAYYASMNGTGTLLSSSYYGGPGDDYSYTIINDHSGNIYLSGYTTSMSGISTSGAYQPTYGGGLHDGFLAKINYCSMPAAGVITGSLTACVGSTITLTASLAGGSWSSSNSAIATVGSSSGVVSGIATGSVIISYGIANTCGISYATHALTVNATPVVASISGLSTVCIGSSIALSDATPGGTWSSSNPSVATVGVAGSVFGVAAGVVTISYGVSNSCGTTYATYPVTVNAVPVVGAISGPSTVCVGSVITLANATAGGVWSSGAMSIAAASASTGDVTGISTGSANISYTVTNTCGSTTVTYPITVNTLPVVPPISGPSSVCIGGTITLTNPTTGGTWSAASGTATVAGGIVTGISSGSNTISYSVSNVCGVTDVLWPITVIACPTLGCWQDIARIIVIHPNPTNEVLFVSGATNTSIVVYNTLGQLIKSVNNTEKVSIAEFPKGVYYVYVFNDQGILLTQEKINKL